jgi:PST family polysaccharide transporter/antigen flippase
VPRVSGEHDKNVIKKFVLNAGLLVLFGMLIMFIVFYFGNEIIINVVLYVSFAEAGRLILLQMVGDLFRTIGWVIGFVVVAKAATKLYVAAELFQGFAFLLIAYLFFYYSASLEGVIYSYVIASFFYFIFSMIGFYVFLKFERGSLE